MGVKKIRDEYGNPVGVPVVRGVQGIPGVKGDTGGQGPAGEAATIEIGTVAAGAAPAVENVGTANAAVLNFTIKNGVDGQGGADGPQGAQGPAGLTVSVNNISHSNGNITLNAGNIPITDAGGNFTSTHAEGALAELFTSANNGKTSIASAIGSAEASASNTFSVLAGYISIDKNTMATNLTAKGVSAAGSETLAALAAKIANISSGVLNLVGTMTITGTYANSTYYTAAGCRMGFNSALGEVYVIMQGGNTINYENVLFTAASLPAGVALGAQSISKYTSAAAMTYRYIAILTGVTGQLNISCNLNAINATDDNVTCALTGTYA